jgi:hypothetical protein
MVERRVAQYQFVEKLGAGGMGEIYKALDTRLNRFVAIKVLPSAKSGDFERRRRFLLEAQTASGLSHPSIITIHDVILEGDTEFMVMELVTGKTLTDLIPRGGLRVPQALNYALQMSDALATAHAAGIVHRDLKPANVMITDSGLVKILDFGLAKLMESNTGMALPPRDTDATGAALTIEGSILGTVAYMSPEQAQGKKVDPRTDIFSFGALLYEMLTGRHAFEGDSAVSTLSAILRDEVKPMAEVVPDVPPQLDTVIHRCMRKDPAERWQSMTEVRTALSAIKRESDSGALYTSRTSPADTGIAAKPPAAVEKVSSKMIAGVVLSILLVAIILGFWAWSKRKPVVVPQPAPMQVAPPAAAAKPPEETLTDDTILTLIQEKVPVELILDQIRSAKSTAFDLSSTELIRLNKAGVPRSVIDQMRNPTATISAATASSVPTSSAPPAASAPTAPGPRTTSVTLADGTPIKISLADAIPSDANVGLPLRFSVSDDFRVQGILILPKGAIVYGEITETPKKRKFLGIGNGKLSFSLSKAQLPDGSSLKVRPLPAARKDGDSQRPVEAPGVKGAKDIAAPPGTAYIAYIDGEQHATVPQK